MLKYFTKSKSRSRERHGGGGDGGDDKSPQHEDAVGDHAGKPVLSDEDEMFLLRVASEGEAPELSNATSATSEKEASEATPTEETKAEARKATWSDRFMDTVKPKQDLALQKIQELSEARQAAFLQYQKAIDRRQTADALQEAAATMKLTATKSQIEEAEKSGEKDKEAQEEQNEVSNILNRLNLSAINQRVVGVSQDTQKLMEKFTQILKDVVNGVPTAYDDLEKLLTEREGQLDKLYGGLPSFLQALVKAIPVKVYAALAPQLAAAMVAEKEKEPDSKEDKKKKKSALPSLKSLVGQKGAVAGMLRGIISFLETRFPAILTGTNIIVSLAVFILLFVFYYCYKRGKEVRLAGEKDDVEDVDVEAGDADDEKAAARNAAAASAAVVEAEPASSTAAEGQVDALAEQLGPDAKA